MNGVCVIVESRIVAWFESVELAESWATENYFGQWLIVPAETAPVRAEIWYSEEAMAELIEQLRQEVQEPRYAD